MTLVIVLAAIGAGIGLSGGLAFNLRLAHALGSPLAATLVNFAVGGVVLIFLWRLGLDGSGVTQHPPLWTLLGGLIGAIYVSAALIVAARLGAGASTLAITLGQVLGALLIGGAGWLGQTQETPTFRTFSSGGLLLAAVALLVLDREK